LDDTLSTLATLSFAIPHAGAFLAGGINAFERFTDNLSRQTAYYQRMLEVSNRDKSDFVVVEQELKRFITENQILKVIRKVSRIPY
jgi:hypothetical protein